MKGKELIADALDPIRAFLINLGRALIHQKQHDWLDMDGAVAFSKKHGVQLSGKYPSTGELESALGSLFQENDEFYASGLSIEGYERRIGWDKKFMIRVYANGPGTCSTSAAFNEQREALAPSFTQETTPESPGKWAMEKSL